MPGRNECHRKLGRLTEGALLRGVLFAGEADSVATGAAILGAVVAVSEVSFNAVLGHGPEASPLALWKRSMPACALAASARRRPVSIRRWVMAHVPRQGDQVPPTQGSVMVASFSSVADFRPATSRANQDHPYRDEW